MVIPRYGAFIMAAMCSFVGINASVVAGERPQVDLSVNVSVSSVPLEPDGIVTVTMTVRNAGPDAAGATLPGERSIIVFEKAYNIVAQPPPYLLFEPASGCSAYADESEPIPGQPGGGISLLFSYYFDEIGPGQSRTCTYRLHVLPTTVSSFSTNWRVVTPNDDDIDASNDRFDYTFDVQPQGSAPLPVPAVAASGFGVLGLGLLLAGLLSSRRQSSAR